MWYRHSGTGRGRERPKSEKENKKEEKRAKRKAHGRPSDGLYRKSGIKICSSPVSSQNLYEEDQAIKKNEISKKETVSGWADLRRKKQRSADRVLKVGAVMERIVQKKGQSQDMGLRTGRRRGSGGKGHTSTRQERKGFKRNGWRKSASPRCGP